MFRRIEAFEEKLGRCKGSFSSHTMARMIETCLQYTRHDIRTKENGDLRKLRWVVRSVATAYNGNPERIPELAKSQKYFQWFFEFYGYIRALYTAFVGRIFEPLHKRFNKETRCLCPATETTSKISQLSPLTIDSGFGVTSSGHSVAMDLSVIDSPVDNSNTFKEQTTPLACPAIHELSANYDELKQLYDFSELDQVVKRLVQLVKILDKIFYSEHINEDVFSSDSEDVEWSFHPFSNALRLIPDIIIKLQKCGWLARKWLRISSNKFSSPRVRLNKVEAIEEKLCVQLLEVDQEIQKNEQMLEQKAAELSYRLSREERAGEMKINIYELDTKIALLRTQLTKAREDKNQIVDYILTAHKRHQSQALKQLRAHYARNQLHRYSLAGRISVLNFQRNLLEDDIKLEIDLKPCIVASTNFTQEMCEKLESSLNRKRKEKTLLDRAIVFLREDRRSLMTQVMSEELQYDKKISFDLPKRRGQYSDLSSIDSNHSRPYSRESVF